MAVGCESNLGTATRANVRHAVYSPPTPGVTYIDGENLYRHYTGEHRKPNSKPILICPSLGKVWVAVDFIAHNLGILTATDLRNGVPLSTTNQTINLGVGLAPADICYPYKPMLGSHAQIALEIEGSKDKLEAHYGPFYNLHLGHASAGTCRERVYSTAMERALHDFYQETIGHNDFDFYSGKETGEGIKDLIFYLKRVSEGDNGGNLLRRMLSVKDMLGLVNEAVERLDLIEKFEDEVRFTECLIANGSRKIFYKAEEILRKAKLEIASIGLPNDGKAEVFGKYRAELKELEDKEKQRLEPLACIAVGGEIYCVEETDIEEELVLRGFYPDNTMGLSRYTARFDLSTQNLLRKAAEAIVREVFGIEPRSEMAELAAEMGMTRCVGGHGLETMELIAKTLKELVSYDGIVIIKPFNCQPQIMAQNIIAHLKKKELPILHLDVDEQTGKNGLVTRIEAFTDLVLRRKAGRLRKLQLLT